jgi:probable F420-dependent oxidoreductase
MVLEMELGVFLPISGRAAGPETLASFAGNAESLGFSAVWAADRIVIPWDIETAYPYAEGATFIVPADRPFLEPLTCLAYLAGRTSTIRLGISVLVLPYRHPLHWAKIVSTIDALSGGRFVLGVGVGWMEEEFAALGAPFAERGGASDEQLRILDVLWVAERCSFDGEHYEFRDIAFLPKPTQGPRLPIWVGGEGKRAQRRAGVYGDAWFPYFVRVTPDELGGRFESVRRHAAAAGRDPGSVRLNCCLPVEVTSDPAPQEPDRLRGTPEQLVERLREFADVGVEHVALQFMVPRYPDRLEQMTRFAAEALPALG